MKFKELKSTMITIRPFKISDIINITKILNDEIGENYYSENDLHLFISNQNYIGYVACFDSQIIGFGISNIDTISQIIDITIADELKSFFKYTQTIGWIKTIAINKLFQKRGIGSLICKAMMRDFYEKKVEAIIVTAWKIGNNVNSDKMLNLFGIKMICEISEYWKNDSTIKNYNCTICGNPPCLCTSVIYGKIL